MFGSKFMPRICLVSEQDTYRGFLQSPRLYCDVKHGNSWNSVLRNTEHPQSSPQPRHVLNLQTTLLQFSSINNFHLKTRFWWLLKWYNACLPKYYLGLIPTTANMSNCHFIDILKFVMFFFQDKSLNKIKGLMAAIMSDRIILRSIVRKYKTH